MFLYLRCVAWEIEIEYSGKDPVIGSLDALPILMWVY